MAYEKNQWSAGSQITAEKMMKIENELESLDSSLETAAANASTTKTEVETARSGYNSLNERLTAINTAATSSLINASNYVTKSEYNSKMISIDQLTNSIAPLQTAINHYEATEDEVLDAHRSNVQDDTLKKRFEDLEGAIGSSDGTSLGSRISALEEETTDINADIEALQTTMAGKADSSTVSQSISDINTALSGKANNSDVITLQTVVGDSTAGLVKQVADNTSAIEVLQNKDTVVMTTAAFDALFNSEDELISTNNVALDADYIIGPNDENKYLYYKILQVGANYKRVLISGGGAGGTGTSSAMVVETLPSEDIDVNTDYYLHSTTGYAHYRYNETSGWMLITPALNSNINSQVNTNTAAITTLQNQGRVTSITSTGTTRADNYYSFNVSYAGSNTAEKVTIEAPVTITSIEKSAEDDSILVITDSTGDQKQISLPAGGGGGTSSGTLGIVRVSDQSLQTLANAEHCYISFRVVARDAIGQDITQSGTATLFINNEQRTTFTVSAAYGTEVDEDNHPLRVLNTYDVLPYLASGVNSIRIQVKMNTGGETDSVTSSTWTVNVINFYLTWNYDESTINDGETIRISWQPYGTNLSKTTHILVDGTEVATRVTTTNGRTEILDLNNTYSHGTHLITLYMTATINNVNTSSASVTHSVIVVRQGNNAPIIATSLTETTMTQYNTLRIPYTVYTPNYLESSVQRYVDGELVSSDEGVDRTTQQWNYTPSVATIINEEIGEPHILRIESGSTSVEIRVNVEALDIPEIKEVEGYDLKLKASDIASNSALQSWRIKSNDAATQLQFSENFDWVNGGIKTEEDANHNLRQFINVRAGSRMVIPYKPFAEDAKINGLTMKIIFKVTRCSNYDASAIDCSYTSGTSTLGFKLNAHNAALMTAAQTVSTQYGEDEYTELEFEIYKQGAAAANYAMIWLDGVMASARNYQNANFSQGANATNITIGSDDCDVQIYLIKIYKTHLSIEDHLANFIADAPNATEMIVRYNRNDILDESGEINYARLAEKNPSCRVWLYDISRMTTGKKDYVTGCKFDQIYLEGGDTITNHLTGQGTLTVQGTSSVNYRKGAANTDINFKDTKNAGAPSSLQDKDGNDLLANEVPGFRINPTSTPITYANMKVNFASCEQVNNMCNAEWYQRYQPYPSLSPRDCMEFVMGVQFIRDHGVNEGKDEEILFARERGAAITATGTYDPNNKGTFDPDKYYMYSIGNLGNSKKNTHVFHGDNECCVEVKENTTLGERMIEWPENMDWTGDIKDGDHSYEMRFPDTKTPADNIKNGWERFVRWMADNNPNAATNEDLDSPVTFAPYTFRGHNRTITAVEGRNFAQVLQGTMVSQYAGTYTKDTFNYRMAKMLSECEDYMAMDSVIYHFCYIERHTMVDNVAKNTFWSSNLSNQYINGVEQENTEGYWIWDLSKNYDNDTSDGNNNNGLLVFDYGNEATDTYDGTPNSATVFNGADSVWFVFASNLYEACQTMFINREALGAWSYKNYHAYLTNEQKKVPERVWNQCYWYDYLRTYEFALNNSNDTTYSTTWLSFLDGGQKVHQRSHYETYQEIYEASKYVSTVSMGEAVVLRGENVSATGALAQKTDFYIQMYNKCYLTIHIGAEYQTMKCNKGETVTMSFKDNQGNPVSLSNSVINIDSGSMIQTIGDLSLLYPSSVTLGNASRLRSLQIGSDLEGYNNPNMNASSAIELNNPLLRSLYVQNLSNATYALNLSNCPELQYLKANGSGFTEYTFANGGKLNEAIIEAPTALTMRNLPNITNAKLTINDYSRLEQLWLENCSLFNDRTLIESAPALDIVRVTGMNWTGSNKITDITTLNNILDMRGLSGTGTTISQSYLQGTVRIEPEELIEQQYIIRYNNAWPNLTIDIDDNKIRKQYVVTFKYDTDTIIADNISEEDSIIAQYYVTEVNSDVGAYLRYNDNGTQKGLDPVALGWIATPTRNMTAQYTYTLGTYTNETYDSFSGWTYNGTRPTMSTSFKQNITLYTNFNRNDRLYNFKWYMDRNDPNSLVKTSNNVIYGGGATESAPTLLELKKDNPNLVTFKSENNKYYIFKGWSHLPLNVTPENQNIYGEWEEYQIGSTSYGSSIDLSSLTPAQLLEVTHNSTQLAKIRTSDRMSIQLGYEGSDTSGRQIINESEHYRKIGRENYQSYSNEQLFLQDKAFTFAIDFKCDSNITSIAPGGASTATYESIIASCYEEDGARTYTYGFKIYYDLVNNCLRVGFGNTYGNTNRQNNTKIIGDTTTALERNMIVIRHPANSTSLYIYHGLGGNGMSNEVTEEIITDASFNSTSFPLVFGACLDAQGGPIDDLTVKNMTYGYGTIYWAKVWDKDLGTGECKQLANWCHEKATFGVVQTTNTNSILRVPNTNLLPRLYLSSLGASAMSGYYIAGINGSGSSTDIIGWTTANYRKMLNQRLYNALPIQLQAIAYSTPYYSRHIKYEEPTDQYNPGTWRLDDTSADTIENDYIAIPSYQEVSLDKVSIPLDIEANGALPWTSGNNATIWNYANNVFSQTTDTLSPTRYLTVRFKGAPISYTPNVYKLSKSAITTGNTAYSMITRNNTLNVGDIWEPIDDATGVMYVYVGRDEINDGAPIEYTAGTSDIKYCPAGGWVASVPWWTRSYSTSTNSYNGINYIYVQTNGYPQVDSSASNRYYIDYSIGF